MSKYRMVLVTASSKSEAEKIAIHLVKKALAACVNIVPKIRSVYGWEGKVEISNEVLLIIKSKKSLLKDLEKAVRKVHSYEVPEIVSIEIEEGSSDYLDWMESLLKKQSRKK
ncbi:divalent-cation tolerance protein CutA [Hydrogenimonas cancrithermarum]|uniref:Divalent-cation tolerance protein CutA n=1 Tax=Hydrogenimonas cancrithermarum TaxID=2993563 RepID=A0ABM8FKE1_9BACT|nr:divalent-cation tolerance protein CutA [Hydrogenimonas cancrithermarum]BDY12129.1 divalent-cation tolerance protein CutA [Hydrogenimonas cancrithermarum]